MSSIVNLCSEFEHNSIEYKKHASLSEYSTFRIGGYAKVVALPKNETELIKAICIAIDNKIKYSVIGNGSNVLFSDQGYNGLIVCTSNIKTLLKNGSDMDIGCGVSISMAAMEAKKASLSGLEFAFGIPGTLGGAVFMNAGAYGSEISDVLCSVKVFDSDNNSTYDISADQLEFGYRSSIFMKKKNLIVLSARLRLSYSNADEIDARMKENMRLRQEKQPLNYPNAGSVFKRTQGFFIGKIIDECGLKGYTIGGAQVSEKHAGFIINKGGATSQDVLLLIEYICSVLKDRYDIDPECEIQYIDY